MILFFCRFGQRRNIGSERPDSSRQQTEHGLVRRVGGAEQGRRPHPGQVTIFIQKNLFQILL
jgi:hypothetical protein